MKNKSFLLILFLLACTFVFSQKRICEGGNCKDGFGDSYQKSTNEIYHGYFKNSKFNGIGMYSNNKGFYYSQFTNDKMNGYTVYYQKGYLSSGKFVNGIKDGVHFVNTDQQGAINRNVITYKNGKEVKTEKLKVTRENFNSGKACISGNCENGNGVLLLKAKNILIIGKFEKSIMLEGEHINLMNAESYFFKAPKDNTKPYFKFLRLPMKDEGGYLEVAAMFISNKKNGQAILYKTKSKQMVNYIYKDDKIVN